MTTRLSSLQYSLLKTIINSSQEYYTIEEAQVFDQRPFRSMLIRKWISYRPSRGFYITREGKQAWFDFLHREIFRQNTSLPLTSYFDPAIYGLKIVQKKEKKQVA